MIRNILCFVFFSLCFTACAGESTPEHHEDEEIKNNQNYSEGFNLVILDSDLNLGVCPPSRSNRNNNNRNNDDIFIGGGGSNESDNATHADRVTCTGLASEIGGTSTPDMIGD